MGKHFPRGYRNFWDQIKHYGFNFKDPLLAKWGGYEGVGELPSSQKDFGFWQGAKDNWANDQFGWYTGGRPLSSSERDMFMPPIIGDESISGVHGPQSNSRGSAVTRRGLGNYNALERIGYPTPLPGAPIRYDARQGTVGGIAIGNYDIPAKRGNPRYTRDQSGQWEHNQSWGGGGYTGKKAPPPRAGGDRGTINKEGVARMYGNTGQATTTGPAPPLTPGRAPISTEGIARMHNINTGFSAATAYEKLRQRAIKGQLHDWEREDLELMKQLAQEEKYGAAVEAEKASLENLPDELMRQYKGIANMGVIGPAGMNTIYQSSFAPQKERLEGLTGKIMDAVRRSEERTRSMQSGALTDALGGRAIQQPGMAARAISDNVVEPSMARTSAMIPGLHSNVTQQQNMIDAAIGDMIRGNMESKLIGLQGMEGVGKWKQSRLADRWRDTSMRNKFGFSPKDRAFAQEYLNRIQNSFQLSRDRMLFNYQMKQMHQQYLYNKDLSKKGLWDYFTDLFDMGKDVGSMI